MFHGGRGGSLLFVLAVCLAAHPAIAQTAPCDPALREGLVWHTTGKWLNEKNEELQFMAHVDDVRRLRSIEAERRRIVILLNGQFLIRECAAGGCSPDQCSSSAAVKPFDPRPSH